MDFEGHVAERPGSRADLRRRKVIDSARRLFIANGFHATGIAQITRESEVAVGQIYRDFASKEDIVAAIVEEDCAVLCQADALDQAIEHHDDERIVAWLARYIELDGDVQGRRLFAEIVAESGRNARIASIFSSLQEKLRSNILKALEKLAPNQCLEADRLILANTIATFSLGLLHHQLMRPGLELQPLEQRLREILVDQLDRLRRIHHADGGPARNHTAP